MPTKFWRLPLGEQVTRVCLAPSQRNQRQLLAAKQAEQLIMPAVSRDLGWRAHKEVPRCVPGFALIARTVRLTFTFLAFGDTSMPNHAWP